MSTEYVATLTRVPGIGRKGAQRLVLELRDRLSAASTTASAPPAPGATTGPWAEQVSAALVSLGWGSKEASAALDAVAPRATAMLDAGEDVDVPALLRAALRSLDRS